MNSSETDLLSEDKWPISDSRNCTNLIADGPGDTTVRPARPILRKFGEAERERIARWQQPQDNLPDGKEQPGAETTDRDS
jgi:hypothetical protein